MPARKARPARQDKQAHIGVRHPVAWSRTVYSILHVHQGHGILLAQSCMHRTGTMFDMQSQQHVVGRTNSGQAGLRVDQAVRGVTNGKNNILVKGGQHQDAHGCIRWGP
jgi:hypothetical protein